MAKRKCKGTTKAGKACRAVTLVKGKDYCIAHLDPAEKAEVSPRFQVAGGRPPKPRLIDVLIERMEDELDDWLKPLYEAREATKHVVVGNGPTAHVEEIPDLPTRLAALKEYADRTLGKSRQTTEITGADGGALKVSLADLMERAEE